MSSTTAADRLGLLQEHIRLTLLERKRAQSQSQPHTGSTHEISRSLDTLLAGIEQLEKEQKQYEERGELSSQALREREDILVRLRSQYDDLHAEFTTPPASSTPILSTLHPNLPSSSSSSRRSELDDTSARQALMGQRATPSALRKSVRFSDAPDDTNGGNAAADDDAEQLDNHQVLQLHRRVMEEQDRSLDRLSVSIRSQRELSVMIGDELESQVLLLDDVEAGVERGTERLEGARRRLGVVARKAKDHGSLVVIAVLIIILVLLIAIIKWYGSPICYSNLTC